MSLWVPSHCGAHHGLGHRGVGGGGHLLALACFNHEGAEVDVAALNARHGKARRNSPPLRPSASYKVSADAPPPVSFFPPHSTSSLTHTGGAPLAYTARKTRAEDG